MSHRTFLERCLAYYALDAEERPALPEPLDRHPEHPEVSGAFYLDLSDGDLLVRDAEVAMAAIAADCVAHLCRELLCTDEIETPLGQAVEELRERIEEVAQIENLPTVMASGSANLARLLGIGATKTRPTVGELEELFAAFWHP